LEALREGFLELWYRFMPDVVTDVWSALWEFIDGFRGVGVALGSIVLTALFAFAALRLRDRSGWLSSIFGLMAGTVVMFWLFGIIPSAWVYFSDGQRDLLGGRVIPEALPGMGNFYLLFRDLVVVGETGVAIGAMLVVIFWIQKRYPRSLAEGEEARPQSGGYK